MMTHETFDDLLLQYMTHSISPTDRMALTAHLAECAPCRAALAEWRDIAAAVRLHAQERKTMIASVPVHAEYPMRRRRLTAMLVAAASVVGVILIALFNRPAHLPTLVAQIATSTPTAYVDLVLAARDIENGALIQPEDVTLYPLPVDYAPFNGVVSPDDVVGKIARTNIRCGLPILANLYVENAHDVPVDQPTLAQRPDCNLPRLTEPVETRDVVTMAQEIPAGMPIPAEAVVLRPYPAALLPEGALTSLDDVVGKAARTPLYREQVVMPDQLQEVVENVELTIPATAIQNAGSLLPIGSRVDVITTILFVDLGDAVPSGAQSLVTHDSGIEGTPVTQRLIGSARVVSVQTDATDAFESVTLSVTPEDATTLTWIIEAKLQIVLVLVSPP